MPLLAIDTLTEPTWTQWPGPLVLPVLAVFRYRVEANDQAHLQSLLLPDEQQRADRFRQVADRQRFIAGRGWLRWLVGRLTGLPPRQIQLTIGPSGKPELTETSDQWHINVSHAGEWVLLAVGNVPVGVDVEWINPTLDFLDMVPATFNPDDQAHLACSEDSRSLFYTFWTRKESLFKATGQGLTNDFTAISVSKGIHVVKNGLPEGSGTWSVASFAITTGYVGAVACQEPTRNTRFFTLDSALLNITSADSD